jgi:hypothetical protein
MSGYRSKFDAPISSYPFARWQKSGLEQYTPEACAAFTAIFDRLVKGLVRAGEDATEQSKLELLHQAVNDLNALNQKDENLIETGEREELCALVNLVTVACGLDPRKYGDGEGPASEWREW